VADTSVGWSLIAGTAIVVYLTRALFVVPGSRLRLPPLAERILRYAPAAALMAIIVPDLALAHGALVLSPDNPRLVGGVAAFVIAATTRNIMLTIVGGMLALTAVRLLTG
jgi:branched-subunit amino acid transport protein